MRTTEELERRVKDAHGAIHKAIMDLTGYGENNLAYLADVKKVMSELAAKLRESEELV